MASPMRQAIARLMTFSKQNIPHYYLQRRAEMSAAMDRRDEWNAAHGKEQSVSVNDLLLKAVALALQVYPQFNAFYQDGDLAPQESIHLGIAIALPDGLIAPAILECENLSLTELGIRTRDLAARARQGVLRAEEYTAATFTITNLGMYDIDSFHPIIVPPQVGILAAGSINTIPALQDGELITERRMALTLAADHRATDGAEGARFLGEIVSCLQNPEKLFV